MPDTSVDKPPTAFDGVIPPKNHDSEAAVDRAHPAAEKGFLGADGRQAGAARGRPLDDIDAAIAEDADGVIESVFASVEDLLGDGLLDETFPEPDESVEADKAAMEEDAPQPAEYDVAKSLEAEAGMEDPGFGPIDPVEQAEAVSRLDEPPPEPLLEPATQPELVNPVEPTESVEQEALSAPTAARSTLIRRLLARLATMLQPRRLLAVVLAVLSVMALPLRLMPDWARPYADWLALSLVFWIPVIWVVALFVVGQ